MQQGQQGQVPKELWPENQRGKCWVGILAETSPNESFDVQIHPGQKEGRKERGEKEKKRRSRNGS